MSASIQITETDAGFHGVIVGGNGEPAWTTEVHPDRRDALNAIRVAASLFAAGGLATVGRNEVNVAHDLEPFGAKLSVPIVDASERLHKADRPSLPDLS